MLGLTKRESHFFDQPFTYHTETHNFELNQFRRLNKLIKGDFFMIEGLMIPLEMNLDFIGNLCIDIDGIYGETIPFYLIHRLSEIKKTSTHYILTIPSKLFVHEEKTWGHPILPESEITFYPFGRTTPTLSEPGTQMP